MAAEVAAAADGAAPADGALAVGGAIAEACEATFMEDLHQKAVTWLLRQLTVEESVGVKKYTDVCHFLSAMHPSPGSIQNFAECLQILDRECCKVLPLQPEDEFIQVIPVPPQPGSFSRHRVHLWQLGYVEGASMKGAPRQTVALLHCCYCCCWRWRGSSVVVVAVVVVAVTIVAALVTVVLGAVVTSTTVVDSIAVVRSSPLVISHLLGRCIQPVRCLRHPAAQHGVGRRQQH